jgi:C4-dicarboxylate-specific signal transduction histidine kinase
VKSSKLHLPANGGSKETEDVLARISTGCVAKTQESHAGMSAGNIVHEIRELFDQRRSPPRAIDLNTLIEQVISLQSPDVRDKEVAIDCELNPDLPVAFADAAQIQQVLFNLLVDATDAIYRFEEPMKLALRTDFTDDHVSLEVENSGGCVAIVNCICSTRSSRMYHEEQSWRWQSVVSSSRRRGTLEATRRFMIS